MRHYPPRDIRYGVRLRPSPYFEATLAHGATAFTVYNHMLMPVAYDDPDDEYRALVERVSVWDVGCERQVEITGPDAAAFVQRLVTRDVTAIRTGRARYALVCREDGGILNDPVLLRLAEDRFWLSVADSDVLLWALGVATATSMEIVVREPDVSPLQVQGPRSADTLRPMFGSVVDQLPFYAFVETAVEGVPVVLARTGWSGELGFEIFLQDGDKGGWLWERIFAAGHAFGIRAGAPNQVRRIETGLLSYGADMDASRNPFEMGLERFVDLNGPDDFIGREALRRIAQEDPVRRSVGLLMAGDPIRQGPIRPWQVTADGEPTGVVTSAAWSPTMEANIALGVLGVRHARPGVGVVVDTSQERREAVTTSLPFIAPRYRD